MREAEEEVRVIPCEKDSACIPDPKDGGRGHKPRNATGWPLIVGKGKKTPRVSRGQHCLANTLALVSETASRLLTSGTIR